MAEKNIYRRIAEWSAIIFILPSSMAAGAALGYYMMDKWLNTTPLFAIVFLLLGALAGFIHIYKLLKGKQA